MGSLGSLLNERMRNMSKRKGGMTGKLLDFFSIAPEAMAEGPDLSKIVRGKAVAFDGYAHRSIVEVIPSYLSDIHSELVAMRRSRGIADPTDRKLYDFKTGRMTSEKLMKAQFEKNIDRRAMSGFEGTRKIMGDGGNKQTAVEIQAALRTLGKEQFSINAGSAEDFAAQIDSEVMRLAKAGKTKEAAALKSGKHHLVRAREKYGARYSAKLQSDILSYNREYVRAMSSISNEEGAARMMFSGEVFDAEKRRAVAGGLDIAHGQVQAGSKRGPKKKATASVAGSAPSIDDDIYAIGDGEGFQNAKAGSFFRDANGKVTFRSILAAPMNAVSKAMTSFENKVSDVFFGDGKKKGVFASIKDSLLGDVDPQTGKRTGPLGKVLDFVRGNVFDPLKKALVGDPSDPSSQKTSIVGTTKRWFKEAVDSGKTFLFGKMVEGANGELTRQGGLFGGVVNWFSGKSKQLKEFLLGKGGDGKNPGLLTGLREKFDNMVKRVQVAMFGTVGEDGRRSGGAFGDSIQKGKDFLKGLWDKFQETAVKPLGQALFGQVGADGKRSGGMFGNALQKGKDFMSKLWTDTKEHVLGPMKQALFGAGKEADDGFGNIIKTGQGIFPKLWDTFKMSVVEPLAEGLLGKKTGPNGERQGGALPVIWQSMKDAMAPLKETFVGKDGIWTNMKKGLSDTFTDLKRSLFGGEEGDDRPFMERIGEKISGQIKRFGDWMTEKLKPVTEWIQEGGDWLKTKVFEPFNHWLNDPKTGFITRMREGAATFFYGKQNEDGVREGGLFGAVKKGMDRFFYGDPNDPNRKGFVERVVEPAKKFVLEEIWQPLKKNMVEMWDETKDFLKKEVWAPLQGVMQPFFTEAKEQWKNLKEWGTNVARGIGDSINATFKNAFGKSLSDMLRQNVLDPIKDALSGVKKFLMTSLKAVLKFPVNVLRGASDELAASQIRRGIFKGSAEERARIMARNNIDPSSVPHGSGSSVGAQQPGVKAGGSVTESGGARDKEGGFLSRLFGKKSGKDAAAMEQAAVAGAVAAGAVVSGGSKGAASVAAQAASEGAKASSDGTKGSGKQEFPTQTRAEQAQADAASGGSSVKGSGRYDPIRIAQATADNTSNIYQFMTKHLWGVGKNVERIVKHFKIKDTALGGNTDAAAPSGFLGKLRKLITNPISFVKDTIAGAFDYIKGIGKRLFDAAKNVVMVPVKLLGKALSGAVKAVTATAKAIAPLAGILKDALVNTLTAAVKVTATVFKESAKAVGTVVSTIAKAIPDVANALASATVGILKAGAQLALGAVKILGSLTATLAEVGAQMLTTAVKVTKDVVTGLARVTFDAIGSAFNMITGRGKGGGLGKLTPVYVTGGFLAGTSGGASSLAEAKTLYGGGRMLRTAVGAAAGLASGTGPLGALIGAGLGFFSPEMADRIASGKATLVQGLKRVKDRIKAPFEAMTGAVKRGKDKAKAAAGSVRTGFSGLVDSLNAGGESLSASAQNGWQALKDRSSKAAQAVREVEWKDKLLTASEKTTTHLQGIRTGFSRFGNLMMTVLPAIGTGIMALVNYFKKGEFLFSLAKIFGKEGMIGKIGSLAKGAKNVGARAMKGLGGLKGVGIAAAAGIGGSLIKGWADDNMEDGLGKSAVKTGGSMLEYGAIGATVGSIIPGVGTAVGAGVGAAVGAAVENWDAIVSGAKKMWEVTKKAGRTIADAAGSLANMTKNVGKAIYSHFFGNDVEIDEKTGKVLRQEQSNVLGRMWETLVGSDEKQLADGQVVKEGGIGILGNVKNFALNAVGVFGKMLSGDNWEAGDFIKGTVLEGITTKIENGLQSFIDGMIGIKDGLVAGFKYVTEFKFIDDLKSAVSNWWNNEDEAQKQQAGGSEFVGPSDTRSWYQKLGQKMTSWADGNKAKVNTVTVGKDGQPIANRAFGGPLGRNGTLVGELGPELLDANGNVIPMGKMQNPALGGAAQARGDSIASILDDIKRNSYYTTTLLGNVNTALGGQPVKASNAANDMVFNPKNTAPAKDDKKAGLFGVISQAFGFNPETGQKLADIGAAVGDTASEVGEHVGGAIRGAASSVWAGLKGAASSVMSGDFSGAGSALRQGFSGAGTAISAGISGATESVKAGASSVASVIRGDGKKNLDMLKSFMTQQGMTDPKEQAMFLSQLDHESGGFRTLSENLRYSPDNLIRVFPRYFKTIEEARQVAAGGPEAIANRVYGGRMGNKQDGDGFKYRGRGFIQLTGRDNYIRAGKDLGLDLENNPDLASQPENAAKIALWYWKQRGLSGPAQKGDVLAVTKGINGGTNGLDDRKSKFAKYLSEVGSTAVASGSSPIKTAMLGGFLSKHLPTLVGEREPEVLGPDGRIHRSVDSYLSSPSADVSGLMTSTAVKEAMKRASSGPDNRGAGDAISKIMAAGGMGGNSEAILTKMLEVLQQIAGNTAAIGQLASAEGQENKTVSIDASGRTGGNVFAISQPPQRSGPGMSQAMQRVVSG